MDSRAPKRPGAWAERMTEGGLLTLWYEPSFRNGGPWLCRSGAISLPKLGSVGRAPIVDEE